MAERHPGEIAVVGNDDLAVSGHLDINFDPLVSAVHGSLESTQRVFGRSLD